MSANGGIESSANGGNAGGNGQDGPAPSNPAGDTASTSGPGTPHVPGNTAGPTSAPGERTQTTTSATEDVTAQETAASSTDRNKSSLPQGSHPNANTDAGPERTTASQMADYSAWITPDGAASLQATLEDDIAAPFRQAGAGREAFRGPGYADIPDAGAGAGMISPLSLNHAPGVQATNFQSRGRGPYPRGQGSEAEDNFFIPGREDMGAAIVPDLIRHTVPVPGFDPDPRPLPPTPRAPSARAINCQLEATSAPRSISILPRLSTDATNNPTTDDRDTLPSAITRKPGPVSASASASPVSPRSVSDRSLIPKMIARREESERSKWHITSDEEEEEESGPADTSDSPAPPGDQGKSQASEETRGVQGGREHPEESWPVEAEARSTTTIHTPIPTRPLRSAVWTTLECAPEPQCSHSPNPSTPLQQGSGTSTPETAIPSSTHQTDGFVPVLQAYNVEPPRVGRGFDLRRARAPLPGTRARTHLFTAPQFLPGAATEQRRIIEAYNAAFDATSEVTRTLLSTRHRYPGYARDKAALYRKLEFEAATGESMSEDAYYGLFDLETANDGMISALLEWMQGRVWVKVPFVNRIIHQVCRLMFTSAQEEARLRLKFRRDCDALKDEVDAADEICKMERMRDSWQRMVAAVKRQHHFVMANSDAFRAPPVVRDRCNQDARRWDLLSTRFTRLLRQRQDIEDTIGGRREVLKEDLGQLSMVFNDLEANSRDTGDYLRLRKEKALDPKWFQSDNERLLDYVRLLNEDVHCEEEVRSSTTATFLQAATRRLELRDRYAFTMDHGAVDLPEPTIPVFPSPQMLDSRDVRPGPQGPAAMPGNPQAAGPESRGPAVLRTFDILTADPVASGTAAPSDIPAQAPVDYSSARGPRPDFTDPWREVELMRPRRSCTRCQSLEQELEAKQRDVDEGLRVSQAKSAEVEKLKRTLKAIENRDVEKAFEHIDDYQHMVRTDLRDSLQFIIPMLEMHSQRAYDQANLLETSLRFWQTGGSLENVLTELQPMARSVRRLANAVRDLGSQISGQLEKIDSKKKDRLRSLDENARQRRLIRSLKGQAEALTAQTQQGLESHAIGRLDLARTIQQQMQAESDRLKEQVRDCQNKLQKLKNGSEGHNTAGSQPVDTRVEELDNKLMGKEVKLSELEGQNVALEAQLATTAEKIETLRQAEKDRDEEVRKLERHVEDLQTKLEAKAEAAKWSWMRPPPVDDPDFENQPRGKIFQLRTELIEELGRAGSRSYQKFDTEARRALPGLAQGVLWPKKSSVASGVSRDKQSPEEGVKAFWRLAAFSRKRGEVVAALELRDLEGASERLDHLQAWNAEIGPWQTEAQTGEVLRTINFLRSYANLELGKAEGFGEGSSERIEAAKGFFHQAISSSGAECQPSWDSLKKHLSHRLYSGGEEPTCECEFKPRICPKHKRDGGARYHNFMEEEDPQHAEIELTQEAYNSLREHAQAL